MRDAPHATTGRARWPAAAWVLAVGKEKLLRPCKAGNCPPGPQADGCRPSPAGASLATRTTMRHHNSFPPHCLRHGKTLRGARCCCQGWHGSWRGLCWTVEVDATTPPHYTGREAYDRERNVSKTPHASTKSCSNGGFGFDASCTILLIHISSALRSCSGLPGAPRSHERMLFAQLGLPLAPNIRCPSRADHWQPGRIPRGSRRQ